MGTSAAHRARTSRPASSRVSLAAPGPPAAADLTPGVSGVCPVPHGDLPDNARMPSSTPTSPARAPRAPVSTVAAAGGLSTIYLVWGSTYLAIALVVQTMPPLLSAGARFLVAGALVLAWCWLRGAFRAERPTLRQWGAATVVGTLLLLGGNGMVMLAEQRIPSGVTALLIGTLPIWIALLDGIVNRRAVSRFVVVGLVAGLAGVAILVVPGADLGAVEPLGAAMAIGASVSWAAGSLYARGDRLPRGQLLATGMEMLCGGAVLALAGLALGELGAVDPARFSTESLLALGYLVIVGSLVGFTVYLWLLQNVATSTVATYAYVNPVVAVLLGWLFLGESVTLRTVFAAVIIIGAVAAMVRGRPQRDVTVRTAPGRAAAGTEERHTRAPHTPVAAEVSGASRAID